MNREKRLLRNTLVLALGTFFTKGILFLMTPLFTRWLTQADYGMFDLISTYVSLLIPLTSFEIGQATFRFLMNDKENKNSVISDSLIISCISCVVSALIIFVISSNVSSLSNCCFELFLFATSQILFSVLSMIIRGLRKISVYALSNVLSSLVMIMFVVFFMNDNTLELSSIICAYGIGYFVADLFLLFFIIKGKYLRNASFNFVTARKMIKYSLPLIPCDVSWWVMNVSDRTIVNFFLGAEANAIIAVAHKIPNICQNFFSVFHLSWQESAIDSLKDDDKTAYYSKIMNNMFFTVGTISVVILSMNFLLFNYVFTSSYFLAYYQVPIMMISIILSMLAQFLGSIYVAMMQSNKSGFTTLISAIINIVIHFALIGYIGIYASSISTLISYLILFLIRLYDINKNFKITFTKSSYIMIIILMYYFASVYVNNIYVNIINIFLAFVIFIVCNMKYIKKIVNRKEV